MKILTVSFILLYNTMSHEWSLIYDYSLCKNVMIDKHRVHCGYYSNHNAGNILSFALSLYANPVILHSVYLRLPNVYASFPDVREDALWTINNPLMSAGKEALTRH